MSSDKRKFELEQKKAKLAAMREEKRRKEEEQKARTRVKETTPEAPVPTPQDMSQILDELGIPATQSPSAQSTLSGSSSMTDSTTSLVEQSQQGSQQERLTPKRKVHLTLSKVTQTNVPPRENVSYSKETQTQHEQFEREALTYVDIDDDADSMEVGIDTPPPGGAHGPHSHSHHQHHMHHRMPHVEMARPAEDPSQKKEEDKPAPPREMTEEEKAQIFQQEDFLRFIEKSTRIIERAVTEEVDVLVDYGGDEDADKEGGLADGEKVKLGRQFFDERWSKHRHITSLDWSSQHPELLLASYNANEESPHEPDGVALIWNMKFKKTTPEYILHCQSAVTSACFAKFHPNLIVGGTYSGQIVLWDNRSHKRTPVQRTPLSASAHTHPLYCMQVVGTPNAHNLVSISTDGRLCAWSLDMLASPAEAIELQVSAHKQSSRAVAATCLAFLPGDVNNFVVGSEEGAVYSACRHGGKAGIIEIFEGHQGSVTGIHANSVPGPVDFSPYFLSSSFDWTVKLWNVKESRPLYSFEDNSDYVLDTKWSPIHPALFAAVDGTGRLDLWNLNSDMEVPTATVMPENNVALNNCLWHQNGHQISVGDDLGKIHVFDVNESLANPKPDEWQRFVHTLQEMKQNQADQDEDKSFMASPLR